MEPEDAGNAVILGDTIIPAMNIQIDGFPQMFTHEDGFKQWYPIYFEIMFEDGDLWEITQGELVLYPDNIIIREHFRFDQMTSVAPEVLRDPDNHIRLRDCVIMMPVHWETVVLLYDDKRKKPCVKSLVG